MAGSVDRGASRPQKVYAARIRGERRQMIGVKVRPATLNDLKGTLDMPHVVDGSVSQLVRRYIFEGLAADKDRAAKHT